MFRKILVAVDGSEHSNAALAKAVELAAACKAMLVVMTVIPRPADWSFEGVPYGSGSNIDQIGHELEQQFGGAVLDQAIATIPDAVPFMKVLTSGSPGQEIVDQLAGGDYDLVVLGSRGRSDVRSLVLGSVSHHVLNGSNTAALVVRTDGG